MNIREQIQNINSLEFELYEKKMELVAERAYLKGVQDGQSKYNYPPVLTKKDLEEIFQASSSTIDRTVARKDFPKLTTMSGKYPRDEVFAWISRNSTDFGSNLLKFKRA
ncbi:helix-turn-helix transcriptional regulator [Lysinibacillus sp. RS5]|uniref:helix-turn-helix transcriptional regulator n=1 Tax=unclassified Lysinibacillus TaxID=2636778 RepID=UPI0035BE6E8B